MNILTKHSMKEKNYVMVPLGEYQCFLRHDLTLLGRVALDSTVSDPTICD